MPVFTLAEIAEKINGELNGPADLKIERVAEIAKAGKGDITFLANPKYKNQLLNADASAVIIDGKTSFTPPMPFIKTADAYFGFLEIFLLFNPPKELLEPGIHPSAVVHESAQIADGVRIGANVYIGAEVCIGKNSQIFPNCVILNESQVGEECKVYPLVNIREDCRVGNRVIIHSGSVIGSDGFGFVPLGGKYHKIPQLGKVIIEDDVEIGANVTVDRATIGETVIQSGTKIDNLVQIAHNVVVGENCVMAAQSAIAGSTIVGQNAMIGGQAGINGHIALGNNVKIAAKSGVAKNLEDDQVVFGTPARPMMHAKKIEAVLNNLPELSKRIRELEKILEKQHENKRI